MCEILNFPSSQIIQPTLCFIHLSIKSPSLEAQFHKSPKTKLMGVLSDVFSMPLTDRFPHFTRQKKSAVESKSDFSLYPSAIGSGRCL